jgi:hypothetical protein
MSDVMTFGFDNEEIKGGLFEKYKAKKNETHRTAIVYSDPKAMFVGHPTHFKDRYFFCKKGKCCEVLGPAKYRVGAVLIKYNTDRAGVPKKPFAWELFPWAFSEVTYLKLKSMNAEFPLATHDIKISCTNEEYQHLDIVPCNECLWISRDELKTQIQEQAKPIWDSLKKTLASDLTVEQIGELLGIGGGTVAGVDPSSKLDMDSVLNSL